MQNKIETIGIIGAGALGLLYADHLSRVEGLTLHFLAQGSRLQKIRTTRFTVNGRESSFQARSPAEVAKPVDLLLIAVKNHHLTAIGPLLETAAGADTIIISVLNGIGSEDFLRAQSPAATVVPCVAVGMDAVKEGDALIYTNPGRLLIGSEDDGGDIAALTLLASFFTTCAIPYRVEEDIRRALWWKWMINIGVNQVSAVTGARYGLFQRRPELQQLMEAAMRETVQVARLEKVDLNEDDIKGWYTILNGLGKEGKTSMLQDIEARRKTEVEAFSGALLALAEAHGVDLPVNRTLFHIITTREIVYKNGD